MNIRKRIEKLAGTVKQAADEKIGYCSLYNRDVIKKGGHVLPCTSVREKNFDKCEFLKEDELYKRVGRTGDWDKDIAINVVCMGNYFTPV